jgi:hypothetical protein
MSTIAEITKRMNDYVAQLDSNIEQAIIPVDHAIVELNREQLKGRQVTAADQSTPEYSSFWKSKKGLTNWNIFNSGATLNSLLISITGLQYKIYPKFTKNMEKLQRRGINTELFFGIAPSNKDKAYSITTPAIGRHFKRLVFGQ